MKTILVTGGLGFIGSHLIIKLLKLKYNVINVDKISYASNNLDYSSLSKNDNYFFIKKDLAEYSGFDHIFNDFKPDAVLHLAAESHVDNSISNPSDFVSSNVIGTTNLLKSSKRYYERISEVKKQNFRFIHISTDEVFGSLNSTNMFTEDSPYKPNSPYSASKAASDHFVRAWISTYQFPAIITNCSNNFGPYQHKEKLIPLVIDKALKGEPIPVYGDGKNVRDWIYVLDHVDAILSVLEKGIIGESYCIGASNEISNIELVIKICSILDLILPKFESYINLINFVEDRLGHDFRYAIDSSKIRNHLTWKPQWDFNTALEHTINWYITVYTHNKLTQTINIS